jgi:tubulin-specific chaperone A
MSDPRIKTLKIKSGVVKRLTKEKIMYAQEAEKQDEKVQQMKAKSELNFLKPHSWCKFLASVLNNLQYSTEATEDDEYYLRKQEEVLAEARMMVPECHKRLLKAYEDLKNMVDCESDLKEFGDYTTALGILSDAKVQIDATN